MKTTLYKRLRISVVALSLVISNLSMVNVSAQENSKFRSSVTYTNGNYTFDKLSHPNNGVSTPDGIVDYIGGGKVSASDQGQGDRGQSYAWSAVSYGDWVYVGTCYAAMGNTLKLMKSVLGDDFDEETMSATLKTMYNGTFFYGQEKSDGSADEDSQGILVKVNVNTGETKLLMSKSIGTATPLFRNAVRFKDKLYFCGSVSGLPSIYCIDPETDNISCVYTGMTYADLKAAAGQNICTGIRGMAVYNDQLVVSCVGLEGPYIMITSNPFDSSSFKKIATQKDLYNYPAYHYSDSIYGGSIWEIVEFNGSLYVAICTGTPDNKPDEHTMQSFAIVRGDENSDGSWSFTPVVGDKADGAAYTFGIDPERTRAGACNLLVYNDHLYIGEYEDIEIALEDVMFNKNVEFLAKNLEQSVSLYRMDKDEKMELVVGDATSMFPNGGSSGLSSGFGCHENQYIWQSTVYDGKMFLGTFDSSSLLEPIGQFTNGDLLKMTPEEWKSQINYLKVLIELLLDKNISYPIDPLTVDTSSDPSVEDSVESLDSLETNEVTDENQTLSSENQAVSPEDQTVSSENQEISSEDQTVSSEDVSPDAEAKEPATENESFTAEDPVTLSAYDLVQNAITAADERYNNSQIAAYAADSTESPVNLSVDQVNTLVSDIENGSIQPNILDAELSETMISFNKELDSWTSKMEEQGSEDFINEYIEVYNQYVSLCGSLPEKVKEIIDTLISVFSRDNLVAFGKILKYLAVSERGFDMYVSEDGINFKTITTNGFNDPYNHGLRVFATGDNWMVIGTANPFNGTQLWELRESSNPDPVTPVEPVKPVNPVKPVTPVSPIVPASSNSGPIGKLTPVSTSAVKKVTAASKTGDQSSPIVPIAVAGVSLVVIAGAIVVLRKKKH